MFQTTNQIYIDIDIVNCRDIMHQLHHSIFAHQSNQLFHSKHDLKKDLCEPGNQSTEWWRSHGEVHNELQQTKQPMFHGSIMKKSPLFFGKNHVEPHNWPIALNQSVDMSGVQNP